jgi:hypothetical protein
MLTLANMSFLLWQLVTNFWGQPIGPIFENRRLELRSYRLSRNVGKYQFTLRDTPEERRSYLQGGGRLKCSECLLLLAQRTVLHSWGLSTVSCERDSVSRSIMVCPHSQLWARFSEQEHYGLSAQSAVSEIQWAGALHCQQIVVTRHGAVILTVLVTDWLAFGFEPLRSRSTQAL